MPAARLYAVPTVPPGPRFRAALDLFAQFSGEDPNLCLQQARAQIVVAVIQIFGDISTLLHIQRSLQLANHSQGVIEFIGTAGDVFFLHRDYRALQILDELFVKHDYQTYRAGTVPVSTAVGGRRVQGHLWSTPSSLEIRFWINGNCSSAALIWLNLMMSCCCVMASRSSKSLI